MWSFDCFDLLTLAFAFSISVVYFDKYCVNFSVYIVCYILLYVYHECCSFPLVIYSTGVSVSPMSKPNVYKLKSEWNISWKDFTFLEYLNLKYFTRKKREFRGIFFEIMKYDRQCHFLKFSNLALISTFDFWTASWDTFYANKDGFWQRWGLNVN